MSLTKRIWLDLDPAYEDVRQHYAKETWSYIAEFNFRTALNRRNTWTDRPYWDPLWRSSLEDAAKELEFEIVRVNSGMFFRTGEQRDAALELAESIWRKKIAMHRK